MAEPDLHRWMRGIEEERPSDLWPQISRGTPRRDVESAGTPERRFAAIVVSLVIVVVGVGLPLKALWPLGGKHEGTKPGANSAGIFLPTVPGFGNGNDAAFRTVLEEHDGCIFGSGDILVIWPGGYGARRNPDGTVEILDYKGAPVARTGEEITLGGSGWNGKDATVEVESAIGRSLPSTCVAKHYWYAGALSRYPQASPSPDPPDAPGVGTCPSFPPIPSPNPDSALVRDSEVIAEQLGVPLNEVIAMGKVQERIGKMGSALRQAAPLGYGGLYLYWEPCPHVVVMITQGDGSATLDAVKSLGYGDLSYLIWTRKVPYSEHEIVIAQHALIEMNRDVMTDAGTDIIAQKVEMGVANEQDAALVRQRLRDATASGEIRLPEDVFVIEVTAPPHWDTAASPTPPAPSETSCPTKVVVPNVTGLRIQQARTILRMACLELGPLDKRGAVVIPASAEVVAQEPPAGTKVPSGQTVSVDLAWLGEGSP